eukprot:g5427.t1
MKMMKMQPSSLLFLFLTLHFINITEAISFRSSSPSTVDSVPFNPWPNLPLNTTIPLLGEVDPKILSEKLQGVTPFLPVSLKQERTDRINESISKLEKLLEKEHLDELERMEMLDEFDASLSSPTKTSTVNSATTSFVETKATLSPLGGAVAGGAMSMLFSRTTLCVMCSYVLEMCDRQVKAIPRWANGGGGNFPGTLDFSPGESQGYFRTYPGSYLEVDAKTKRSGSKPGSGVPVNNLGTPAILQILAQDSDVSAGARQDAMQQAAEQSVTDAGGASTDQDADVRRNPVRKARLTHRDVDRTDALAEKAMEYQQMFKDFMDALDDTCFSDMPSGYTKYCQMIYKNGEALVELYLHDYEDWEICTEINCCTSKFYQDDF